MANKQKVFTRNLSESISSSSGSKSNFADDNSVLDKYGNEINTRLRYSSEIKLKVSQFDHIL